MLSGSTCIRRSRHWCSAWMKRVRSKPSTAPSPARLDCDSRRHPREGQPLSSHFPDGPPVLGGGLGGLLFALFGPDAALASVAVVFLLAASCIALLPALRPAATKQGTLLLDVGIGLRHVITHSGLRGIALTVPILNIALGCPLGVFFIALPLMLLRQLHTKPAAVGWTLTCYGATSVVSSLVFARASTERRERLIVVAGIFCMALAFSIPIFRDSQEGWLAAAGIVGVLTGGVFLALTGLRQRIVEPTLYGRVVSISASLNALGAPVGRALGAWLYAVWPALPIPIGSGAALLCATLALFILPKPTIAPRSDGEST